MKSVLVILLLSPLLLASTPPDFDRDISDKLVELRRYSGVESIYEGLSYLGDGKMLMATCLLMTILGSDTVEQTGELSASSYFLSQFITVALKCATARERPRGEADCRCRSSFPSGHTSGAFAVAYTIGSHHTRLRIPLFILATGVGISRIGLEAHWASDVLAGAAVGIGSAIIIKKLRAKLIELSLF